MNLFWTESRVTTLAKMVADGLDVEQCAERLGRNRKSIYNACDRNGIQRPQLPMGQRNPSKWTPERDAVVSENWGTLSCAEIAKLLGDGITRSAVIGRARRLSLERLKTTTPHRNKQRNGRPRKTEQPSLKSYKAPEPEEIEPEPEPVILEPEIPRVGKVALIDAARCQCRWMVDDKHVCAKPTVNGSSWCAEHYARVFNPVQGRARNAA